MHSDQCRPCGLDREIVEAFSTAVYGDVKMSPRRHLPARRVPRRHLPALPAPSPRRHLPALLRLTITCPLTHFIEQVAGACGERAPVSHGACPGSSEVGEVVAAAVGGAAGGGDKGRGGDKGCSPCCRRRRAAGNDDGVEGVALRATMTYGGMATAMARLWRHCGAAPAMAAQLWLRRGDGDTLARAAATVVCARVKSSVAAREEIGLGGLWYRLDPATGMKGDLCTGSIHQPVPKDFLFFF
jgi:hypothetical protein